MSGIGAALTDELRGNLMKEFADASTFESSKENQFFLMFGVKHLILCVKKISLSQKKDMKQHQVVKAKIECQKTPNIALHLEIAQSAILRELGKIETEILRGKFVQYEGRENKETVTKELTRLNSVAKFVISGLLSCGKKPSLHLIHFIVVGNDARTIARSCPSPTVVKWYNIIEPMNLINDTNTLSFASDIQIISHMSYGHESDRETLGENASLYVYNNRFVRSIKSKYDQGFELYNDDIDDITINLKSIKVGVDAEVRKPETKRKEKKEKKERSPKIKEMKSVAKAVVPLIPPPPTKLVDTDSDEYVI